MNVLSLFDGMGCGWIALKELGIPVEKAYASEVDKFAISQTKLNFPDVIHLGDVNNWQSWGIHWSSIDLILAGSPCQGFSFAGKGLAFDDPRSKLFFVFVDILNNCRDFNPDVKFLLENVDMKKEYLRIISEFVGLFPVKINSTLVSAQNRERWYWTNIRTKKSGLFDEIHTDIPQPKDRGIFLRDILQPENEVNKKYYLSEKAIEGMVKHKHKHKQLGHGFGFLPVNENEKSSSVLSRYYKDGKECIIKLDRKLNQNKASSLAIGGHGNGDHSDMDILCVAMRGRNPDNPSDRTPGAPTEQRLEVKTDGKTNCLTNVQKDNLVFVGGLNEPNRGDGSLSRDYHQQDRVYDAELSNKAVTVAATMNSKYLVKNPILSEPTHKHGEERVYDEGKAPTIQARYGTGGDNVPYVNNLRRLTPIECSRLQTIPAWYKWNVSDSQIYRMLGNGWTVETVKHILSFISE